MATMEMTPSLSEVLSSLDTSKIPDKLHCPVCDKFLFNGYKSSCCDQAICEKCYGEVSDHCPMCEHRPFSQDLCKPYKAIRNTAKAFLKTHEKKLVDERTRTAPTADTASAPPDRDTSELNVATPPKDVEITGDADPVETEVEVEADVEKVSELPLEDQLQPSIETADDIEVDDDAVNLITEEPRSAAQADMGMSIPATPIDPSSHLESNQLEQGKDDGTDAASMQNMQNMMSMNPMFNGMDMNQMMQMMAASGMTGFNPMMAIQGMTMNPMSQGMFGAFGGPGAGMNGMNGMNMGMNFPPNQGMYGAGWNSQNNNMWNGSQNNNDFGSNAGYGYNQHGNFNQHQYNGDFQNGSYGRGFGRGRGRGRGRGGFDRSDRGRGSFNNFSQGQQPQFQNAHEQQQHEIQSMQASMLEKQSRQAGVNGGKGTNVQVHEDKVDDEFAPGGQEEVQEALGGDYQNATGEDAPAVEELSLEPEQLNESAPQGISESIDTESVPSKQVDQDQSIQASVVVAREMEPAASAVNKQQVAEIYQEESHNSMPPPSAPLGPAAQFAEPVKDFGFRGRGHGRFGSKGRGSAPVPNGVPLSPAKAVSQIVVSSKETKAVGVVGAPTGPKAMREPPPKPAPPATARSNGGGFQIMGRASMASQKGQSLITDRSRSGTPPNLYNGRRSPSPSAPRRPSQHSRQSGSRHDDDGHADHDRERKHRRSKRDFEDSDMDDAQTYDRASSPGESRKSSHRGHREKDRHGSSSKHHSSRSHRHEDTNENAEENSGLPTPSSREDRDRRSGKSSRHESRRERHRESERDHGREERHRDRKRSRHDRDEDEREDEDERRRSRKHKTHHESNGRTSHRSSEAATPVAETPPVDPHTMEREARNKERMLKEQQRREKASKIEKAGSRRSGGGSGRRVSYKYEDEVQAGMGEQERESARWR